ncbi:MAG: hypothetical protein KatS3mg131_1697 [Candidatus Tectimicrobiota bacterium]|nr:MAG: hypothetical protein KatS3mg131_1697 [Candidatus Tectomicrobia bacterium]
MAEQSAFLARVRQALHRDHGAAPGVPRAAPSELHAAAAALQQQLAGQRDTLLARLQHEVQAAGGKAVRVASPAEATAYITRLAQDKGAKRVVRWPAALLETLEVDAALAHCGIDVRVAPLVSEADEATLAAQRQVWRQWLAEADLGLSGVDYAIAETGTLALTARPGQLRGVSLLPPVHVAVVEAAQVVPTLADCLLLLRAREPEVQQALTSCVSFITGPSRSGDIELTLTIGVHGPRRGARGAARHAGDEQRELTRRERRCWNTMRAGLAKSSIATPTTSPRKRSWSLPAPWGRPIPSTRTKRTPKPPPTEESSLRRRSVSSFAAGAMLPDLKLSYGKRGFDGGKECRFYAPIRPGDTITGVDRIAEVYEKTGRSGNMIFVVRESELTNQRGEKVAVIRQSLIRRD